MIDVKNLSKSFGDHLVLDNISEHVHPGEKVVVIGPSGSGKSTFLRCLNLLETPTAGTITFDGTVITDPKVKIDEIRRQMGMVFQHFNLFPNMTVKKNITLAPVRTGLMKPDEAEQTAMTLLRRVGLEDKANAYLMDMLARGNRGGWARHEGFRFRAASGLPDLAAKFADPVLTDISVIFTSASRVEPYPRRVTNLYQAQPIEIWGLCPASQKEITFKMRGLNGAKVYENMFRLSFSSSARMM